MCVGVGRTNASANGPLIGLLNLDVQFGRSDFVDVYLPIRFVLGESAVVALAHHIGDFVGRFAGVDHCQCAGGVAQRFEYTEIGIYQCIHDHGQTIGKTISQLVESAEQIRLVSADRVAYRPKNGLLSRDGRSQSDDGEDRDDP